jgi:predicted component of type VI protein secretion system
MHHLLLASLALGLLASATGCASVPPWDREKLAHPTMTTQDLNPGLDGHVRAVSEGATGGLSGAGGGCGCN